MMNIVLFLAIVIGLLCGGSGRNNNDNYDEYGADDEELKPITDVYRELHPYSYNQFTGGWDEDEDN